VINENSIEGNQLGGAERTWHVRAELAPIIHIALRPIQRDNGD
jgi:hypothetical protein